MNIVVMTGSYYPIYSANSKCLANIVEELQNDHQITVISIDATQEKKKEIFQKHEIIRIRTLSQIRRHYIEDILKRSTGIYNIIWNIILFFYKVIQVTKVIASRYTIETELVDKYLNALMSLDYQVEAILPTCNPIESILAAHKYNNIKKNRIKVIPFLFDKYSTSMTKHRLYFNRIIKMKNHLRLESMIIAQSYGVLTYFSWADHIKKHFPQYENKILYIEHPLIKKMDVFRSNNDFSEKTITIVYAGGLGRKIRPPQYTLELLKKIIDENHSVKAHFYITGNCNKIINNKINKYKKNIINHGTVTSEEATRAMIGASYLLLIGNTDVTQLQSKVYEYMSCAKPIILLYNNREDPVIKILEKYPCVCAIEQNVRKFIDNKNTIISFINSSRNVSINFLDISKIYYDATPEYIANKLIKMIYN